MTDLPTWRKLVRRSGGGGHQFLRSHSRGTEGVRPWR